MRVAVWGKPVTLIFEPWATEHEVPAHTSVTVVWDNGGRDPEIEVVHHPDAIAFYASVHPEVWTANGRRIDL